MSINIVSYECQLSYPSNNNRCDVSKHLFHTTLLFILAAWQNCQKQLLLTSVILHIGRTPPVRCCQKLFVLEENGWAGKRREPISREWMDGSLDFNNKTKRNVTFVLSVSVHYFIFFSASPFLHIAQKQQRTAAYGVIFFSQLRNVRQHPLWK